MHPTTPTTTLRRRSFTAGLLLPLAAPLFAQGDDAALAAAVANPKRTPANRVRDGARHPLETLRFFGVAPGQTVIEMTPGGGWYTEILAPYLRDNGKLFVALYPKDSAEAGERRARTRFEEKVARQPELFERVVVGTEPDAAGRFPDIAPPGGVDRVLTFRSIHNWVEAGTLDAYLRAFFDVLKPGGVLGVEEHRAAPGTSLENIIAKGYVPEAFVIEHARKAGFELAGRSEINANPRDTKDHAKGVWALPPTLAGGDADRARFVAIGESDRMTLRFSKPLK